MRTFPPKLNNKRTAVSRAAHSTISSYKSNDHRMYTECAKERRVSRTNTRCIHTLHCSNTRYRVLDSQKRSNDKGQIAEVQHSRFFGTSDTAIGRSASTQPTQTTPGLTSHLLVVLQALIRCTASPPPRDQESTALWSL